MVRLGRKTVDWVPSKFTWDKWQRDVLDTRGNISIRSGRQVGKSEVISAKAVKFALEEVGTTTLIIAASQRQSSLLFEKVRLRLDELDGDGLLYAEKPTLTKILLSNGSRIYCLPAGRTGYFIRGFTIDMLIADEAAYIPETVWNAVIPMIAVSRKARGMGWLVLLSTPFGKGGYFYDSFTNKDFKSFHVSSEDCRRIPQDFLAKEKRRMTKVEYRQEYMGEFTDEWHQFFPTALVKDAMTFIEWNFSADFNPAASYYLGLDIARYGGDENAFVIGELVKKRLRIVCVRCTDRVSTLDTIGRAVKLDEKFHFRRVFIDDGGVGGAVTDIMMERLGKRRVVGLNNSSKRVQVEGEEKKKGILKEDLYSNALMLLETGKLELIADMDLERSLKSITFEYSTNGNIKISGSYSHIAEALVRACWCFKQRGLNIYCF